MPITNTGSNESDIDDLMIKKETNEKHANTSWLLIKSNIDII